MKQFNGFDQAKKEAASSTVGKLPAGAYVCKILAVKYVAGENGNSDRILVQFDIAEGEYAGLFKKQYEANTSEDKKYKGQTSVYVPKDDGSEKDAWTKKSFAGWTNSFEASNAGYFWNWDENTWVGKIVGIVFGETGTVIEGKEIVYTEARYAVSASDVREGKVKPAKFKAKNGYTGNGGTVSANTSNDGFISVPDGMMSEIPFS